MTLEVSTPTGNIQQAFLRLWLDIADRHGYQSRLAPQLPVAAIETQRQRRRVEPQGEAVFHHFGNLLDQLDQNTKWLQRLQKHDAEKYRLASTIGAVITPAHRTLTNRIRGAEISRNPETWPAFLLCAYDTSFDDGPNYCHPRLICYTKLEKYRDFVPRGVVFYECLAFFTDDDPVYKSGEPLYYYIGVSPVGDINPIEVVYPTSQTIRTKRRRKDNNVYAGRFTINHRTVGFPPQLTYWFNDLKKRDPSTTMRGMVQHHFFSCLNETVAAEQGAQINIRKAGITARFGIPIKRTAYFFKDRSFEVTVNGARRKIFHHVAAHTRITPAGKIVDVNEHYRGVRRFEWNGYEVIITMPDLHHRPLTKFTPPAIIVDDRNHRRGLIPLTRASQKLADIIWTGGEGPQ